MKSHSITVVMRTIGRPTLIHSLQSAINEFENVIVVTDDVDLDFDNLPKEGVKYLRTGKKYDLYGSVGINLGAYSASTEYITIQDDDDEFPEGVGQIMQEKVDADPSVDIWIPTIIYNDGSIACHVPGGVWAGNVSHPTYRTSLFWECPFTSRTSVTNDGSDLVDNCIDFDHVNELVTKHGKKIDWYGTAFCLIRPRLDGKNGVGG